MILSAAAQKMPWGDVLELLLDSTITLVGKDGGPVGEAIPKMAAKSWGIENLSQVKFNLSGQPVRAKVVANSNPDVYLLLSVGCGPGISDIRFPDGSLRDKQPLASIDVMRIWR